MSETSAAAYMLMETLLKGLVARVPWHSWYCSSKGVE